MTTKMTADVVAVRIETVAAMLDTSRSTVLFWIKTGQLPACKVGRSWRVRVSDIDLLLNGNVGG